MGVKVYDADQVTVTWNGILCNKGQNDGEFLTIEYDSPAFTDKVGTDGEVTRSKTNDRRATIKLKLMQTSDTNDLLSAAHAADKNAPGGVGIGVFMARDRQGRSIYLAEKSWISEPPNPSFDREAKEREWTFRAAALDDYTGGN